MDIRILAPDEMIETAITLPLSKSMSNRALIINALTTDATPLESVARCVDTEVMQQALGSAPHGDKDVRAAGTAMRFLTAYYAALPGADVRLDGVERMRRRPIGPLVDVLRACGADITYLGDEGYPPLHIKGRKLYGGDLSIEAGMSSQYISALLMVAPAFEADTRLSLVGEVASEPYLRMTIEMMRRAGIDIERDRDTITVHPGTYKPIVQEIERDWSAASYWYSIVALSAGWVTLEGLSLPSLQGDSRVAQIYERLGVVTESEEGNIELSASPEVFSRLDMDLSDCPDIVQTVVVTCCMIGIPFKLTGLSTLRIKETDRLDALRTEAEKIGCNLTIEGDDTLKWDGKRHPVFVMPEIETYGDHRMAMAFAPAAQYVSGLIIKDAEVVSKSYPGFWDDMQHAGYQIEVVEEGA